MQCVTMLHPPAICYMLHVTSLISVCLQLMSADHTISTVAPAEPGFDCHPNVRAFWVTFLAVFRIHFSHKPAQFLLVEIIEKKWNSVITKRIRKL